MKSPVVFGNPVMFGPVDWNYAAGAPVKKGKSMEELGDADCARERERMAHLQQIQLLHQQQLQQQQVGYPRYGVIPTGQPQGPIMVASPGDPLLPPGCPVPVHGSMVLPVGGTVHVPAQWPVQLGDQSQIRQGNVCPQPSWEYEDQYKTAFEDKRSHGQDVYFHPRSEDGHLELRISEWKGKHCFYQGPEDYRRIGQEKDNNDLRRQEGYSKSDKDRRRRDDWPRENDHNSERYDHRSHSDLEEYDHKDKYKYRNTYDRKYNGHYDDRGQEYYDSRRHRKHDHREHDSYNSEYEDHYDREDTYACRDDYRDSDRYYDQEKDYYDSKDSYRFREKDYYQRREEDCYYDERNRKDRYYDRRADDRYDRRENSSKDRDVHNRRSEEKYTSKGRGQYDSELDEHSGYKDRDISNRYKDIVDNRRDDVYDSRRKDNYKARERYDRKAVDHYDYDDEDGYDSREREHSHHKLRDRFKELRSVSVDLQYEDYHKMDRKTHCEQWVEQQNQKLALREMHSFEDPIIYRHSDEREKGYESSAGSIGSKKGSQASLCGLTRS